MASIQPRGDSVRTGPGPAPATDPVTLVAAGRLAAGGAAESPAADRFRQALDLVAANRREEAVACLEAAVQLDPRHALAWGTLARTLGELRQFDRAHAALDTFARLLPGKAAVHVERARLHHAAGRWKDAEAECDLALPLRPSAAGRFVLGNLLLAYGRLREGFEQHEGRLELSLPKVLNQPPDVDWPRWRGEPLEGRSLLVWPEYGAGDEIQFARFAAQLKERGASRVTLATFRPELAELLGTAAGVDGVVVARLRPLPPHDLWCRMMSVPALLGTTLQTLPDRVPYLASSPTRRRAWAPRLPTGFRVGLVWRGAPIHSNDRHRSLPGLQALAPLWQVPGVNFISLQKGAAEDEARQPPANQPLLALGHEFRSFADTAAVIDQLDLVICVDTSVAHVAGALGKPTWVLLPAWGTDWRWLLEREDSPWYPGAVRLFRQREPGDWSETVEAVAQALRAHVQATGRQPQRQLHVQGRLAAAAGPTAASLHAQGLQLQQAGHATEAEDRFRRAFQLAPDHAPSHAALGYLLHATGRDREAEAHYRKALELDPARVVELQRQLALLLLRCGRFEEGWALYESRSDPSRASSSTVRPKLPFPHWQGEPLQGRSILLWPEQGAGDQIQFARYAAALKARGAARVSIATSVPSLLSLLQRVPGVDRAVSSTGPVVAHDYWCFAMSLPLHLRTTVDTIPAALPYLSAPPDRKAKWTPRLPAGPKVGLVWRGAAAHRNDGHRSLPDLSVLAPLWSVPGVRFISLQKGPGEDEAQDPPAGQPLLALGHEFRDFADTAAVLDQLDLVICVDTSVAHLAGAMGRPVWVLLPAWSTDWRWLAGRSDSPWYPGVMRLFRQRQPGDWAEPVAQAAAALREWPVARQHHGPSAGRPAPGRTGVLVMGGRLPPVGGEGPAGNRYRQGVDALSAGRLEQAAAAFEAAVQMKPDLAPAWRMLARARARQEQFDLAAAALERLVALPQGNASAHVELARLYHRAGRAADAQAQCDRALEFDLSAGDRLRLGFVLLAHGRLQEGFRHYEGRLGLQLPELVVKPPRVDFPPWRGEPLQGRSVLVWPEQGAGDEIQFARFAAALKERGASKVTLATRSSSLTAVLRTAPGVDRVVLAGSRPMPHDYWCWSMSLPTHLGTSTGDLCRSLPYLQSLPPLREAWSRRLPAGPQVGLVWKGSAEHSNDRHRSLPGLHALAALWRVPGVRFVSLQKGAGEDEALHPPAHQPLLALGHEFTGFADTAAVIDQLDLVICVDTSVAHLAGALGKPVWVLLPASNTDWRWMLERTDSPWYPGVMRLFRQRVPGDWTETVDAVAAALHRWAAEAARASEPPTVAESPQALYRRGLALQRARQNGEAEAALRLAASRAPDRVEALIALGVQLHGNGRVADAEAAFREAVERQPDDAGACTSLGIFLGSTGRTAEALDLLRKATQLDPSQANAWSNLGTALQAQGRTKEAEAAYRQAVALSPAHVQAQCNLVRLLALGGRLAEAEAACRQALAAAPQAAAWHVQLGDVHGASNRWKEAEIAYRDALAAGSDHGAAWSGLGAALRQQGKLADGEAAFEAALAREPARAATHAEYGVLLHFAGRFQEAEARYRQALALQPGDPSFLVKLSHLLLGTGRLAEGWPLYESRYHPGHAGRRAEAPKLPFPPWEGESLAGRSLLLWPEQGLGDAIQVVRYAPLLKGRGLARLTVFCPPALRALIETAAGVDQVVTRPEDAGAHDFWCLQMSLPLRFGTTLRSIPSAIPYLHAPGARRARWAARLPAGPKVGLVWKGSPAHGNDAWRSLPNLAALAPLWAAQHVRFVSLQKGQGEPEASDPPPGQPLVALGHEFADLADAAAVIERLDLVICVDTVTAHLAGALGKPVWVLLPALGTDWRWLYDGRTDSPWYPGVMRLFRQRQPGEWAPVVTEVAQALRAWAGQRPASS